VQPPARAWLLRRRHRRRWPAPMWRASPCARRSARRARRLPRRRPRAGRDPPGRSPLPTAACAAPPRGHRRLLARRAGAPTGLRVTVQPSARRSLSMRSASASSLFG
jgi:hypothetical protein